MQVDATQAIRDVENLLRDSISDMLQKAFGTEWMTKCGVTPERIEKWKERKEFEIKRQEGGVVEPRIIYYADFYDLRTILKKNWEKFSVALGDLKTVEVYLGELEKMRDADAHSRDLLPHQKQLANGIAGEIRTRLIRYRSKQETSEDYFPRIESARDSLGNVWTLTNKTGLDVFTKQNLRPNDKLDFVVIASDPLGEELNYRMDVDHCIPTPWQKANEFSVTIVEEHIGRYFSIGLEVKSRRNHHAMTDCDDQVLFHYTVLPTMIGSK